MFGGANMVAALASSQSVSSSDTNGMRERTRSSSVIATKGLGLGGDLDTNADNETLLSEEHQNESDDDDQPVSEVCRRGTCVLKWTAGVAAVILSIFTLLVDSSTKT